MTTFYWMASASAVRVLAGESDRRDTDAVTNVDKTALKHAL